MRVSMYGQALSQQTIQIENEIHYHQEYGLVEPTSTQNVNLGLE